MRGWPKVEAALVAEGIGLPGDRCAFCGQEGRLDEDYACVGCRQPRSPLASVQCPHCYLTGRWDTEQGETYCANCGKTLPAAEAARKSEGGEGAWKTHRR